MNGVDYVCHLASPFPNKKPKNERKVIDPAVNGTETVFKAALA
jgi:dihydroflavonol-4-reductase